MTSSGAKSFTFNTSLTWTDGVEGKLSSPGKPDIGVTPPPEFKGPEGSWSPEDLYVGAVESCLMFTFLSLARSRKLAFTGYDSSAQGFLEQVYGKLVVSRIVVRPKVTLGDEGEREKALSIIERMHAQCFISNSIESDVEIQPEIIVQPAPGGTS